MAALEIQELLVEVFFTDVNFVLIMISAIIFSPAMSRIVIVIAGRWWRPRPRRCETFDAKLCNFLRCGGGQERGICGAGGTRAEEPAGVEIPRNSWGRVAETHPLPRSAISGPLHRIRERVKNRFAPAGGPLNL